MRINSGARMRASSRIISRALYSIYYPRNRHTVKSESAKHAKNTRSFTKAQEPEYPAFSKAGFSFISRAKMQRTKGRFRDRSLRADLAHELVHSMGLSKNERVTASAFGYYFENAFKRKGSVVEKGLVLNEDCVLIEKAFARSTRAKVKDFVPKTALEIGLRQANFDVEHRATILKDSFSSIGRSLGETAIIVEARLELPGAGALLIAEVSRGKKVRQVIRALESGHYNYQLLEWLDLNSSVKRAFQKARKLSK